MATLSMSIPHRIQTSCAGTRFSSKFLSRSTSLENLNRFTVTSGTKLRRGVIPIKVERKHKNSFEPNFEENFDFRVCAKVARSPQPIIKETFTSNGEVLLSSEFSNPHISSNQSASTEISPTQEATEGTKRPDTSYSTLVLMRHGESMWNSLKLFTGDVDIPLTEKGVMEALAGGKAVSHIDFDMIFTSRLVRSKQTALMAMTQSKRKAVPVIVRGGYYGKGKTGDDNRLRLREAAAQALEHAECYMIPVYADQALNERCYGDLQGLNKEAAAKEFGEDVVQQWRRSHDTRPPHGESLMDTWDRCVSFFDSTIEPRLKEGNSVLVVAHGNVLRCIISHISGLSNDEMLRLQVLTALPYTYAYNGTSFAECCVMPPIDPLTNKPINGAYRGLSSVRKSTLADSLI